jgi:hypothetical protein
MLSLQNAMHYQLFAGSGGYVVEVEVPDETK